MWEERTKLLVGDDNLKLLQQAHVLVVGLGGVGSYAAEALGRVGIGQLTIVDGDIVDTTNRNRQLQALSSTIGQSKAILIEQRLKDINPEIKITAINQFQKPEQIEQLCEIKYDYVIDAIDSITPKIHLIKAALKNNQKIISSMGAGGKLDPIQIKIDDISKTYHCPMAYYLRKRLKIEGIRKGFKAVFSSELPDKKSIMTTNGTNFKKSAYGTISYIPAMFGMTCASVVIRDIINWKEIK